MKFTWGTGIVLFLGMFLMVLILFVIFAWNQDVNMVHRDYYEKGADYNTQMEKDKRSADVAGLIHIHDPGDSISLVFPMKVAASALSGTVLFFRPSDHHMDISYPLVFKDSVCRIPKSGLLQGRYIVKISWLADHLPFEVDKTLVVN